MKFRFTRQHDSVQCGIACMHMVCRHYGKNVPMSVLESMCPPSSDGTSLLGIVKTLQSFGFYTNCGKTNIDNLLLLPKPCILHWENRHFVVLYRTSEKWGVKHFFIADPAIGVVRYCEDVMLEKWTEPSDSRKGIAVVLSPTEKFYGNAENRGIDKLSLHSLIEIVKPYRVRFLVAFFTLLAGCIVQMAFPVLTQALVDKGINGRDISFVWLILIGQFSLSIGSAVMNFIRSKVLIRVGYHINMVGATGFMEKLFRLPMSFFTSRHSGDILQRMNDYGRIQSFLTGQMLSLSFALITFVAFSIVLLYYSFRILAVFYSFTALYVIWSLLFINKRKILDYDVFEKSAESQDNVWQLIKTVPEIKLQGCTERRKDEWKTIQEDLFSLQLRALSLQQSEDSGAVLINSLRNITITVMSALAVINGDLSFGMMLAIQYIIGQMSSPSEQFTGFVYAVQDMKISMERINEIRGVEDESCNSSKTFSVEKGKDITLSNVSFRYDRFAPMPTIDNISTKIETGKVTALVGASGSGKTTIMKLILGYYKDFTGNIEVGGGNLLDYNLDSWRSKCGVVMQDGAIFADTITGNITMSDSNFEKAKLKEACRMARIDDFIESLPLKYDTRIGPNGMGISEGQKQRLLIARAIYRNPQYLFMDEATNSLDANTEMEISAELESFYKGRTVLLIAHRLSTVSNADCILVVGEGKIMECGTHEELIEKRGEYYRLIKNQLCV